MKNIVIMGIESDIFLEFTQVLIDNCPLNKYTYDSLKHIYKIGFKSRNCGGFNLDRRRICFLVISGWPT